MPRSSSLQRGSGAPLRTLTRYRRRTFHISSGLAGSPGWQAKNQKYQTTPSNEGGSPSAAGRTRLRARHENIFGRTAIQANSIISLPPKDQKPAIALIPQKAGFSSGSLTFFACSGLAEVWPVARSGSKKLTGS